MTDIQPIHGIPALRVDNALVIADLHIGLEAQLVSKGFHITSRTEDMYDAIAKSAEGCNKLVVLGDVKNSVPGSSKQGRGSVFVLPGLQIVLDRVIDFRCKLLVCVCF